MEETESRVMNLPHIAEMVFNTPLMVMPQKLGAILSVLESRIHINVPEAKGEGHKVKRAHAGYTVTDDGVANIPVYGSITHRPMGLDAWSGMTSYREIQNMFHECMESNDIKAIAFDIDSGGGSVNGAFDFADMIYNARGEKPIYAVVNESAYSAAYLIASACDQIFVPRTAGVGSIGVIAAHMDQSEYDKKQGFKVTTVYAGARKNDFNPHEELGTEAMKLLQAEILETYELFCETVARNRGMTVAEVKATDASCFIGKAALKHGLADNVASVTDAFDVINNNLNNGSNYIMGVKGDKPNADADKNKGQQANAGTESQIEVKAEVVDLDQVRKEAKGEGVAEATEQHRKLAAEITKVCTEAGKPELAGTLITEGVDINQVRERVLAEMSKASPDAIDGAHSGVDKPQGEAVLNVKDVYASRKKQLTK